jgi:hypothetical protein
MAAASRLVRLELVLNGHGVGVYSFLAGNAFKAGEHSPIIVFVALHGEAALLIAVRPGQADEVLL